eukprot:6769378-Pyramimonas_sp.AAC.1
MGLNARGRGSPRGALPPGRQATLEQLRPSLAYALLAKCMAGTPARAEILLDPMCGSNTVAEVASHSEFGKRLFC